jgi:hypothetical protein
MTETQATSGAAGTSTNPVDKETDGSSPGGRVAVGRATVPATDPATAKSAPSNPEASSSGSSPEASGTDEASKPDPASKPDLASKTNQPSTSAEGGVAASRSGEAGAEGAGANKPQTRASEESQGESAESAPSQRPPGGASSGLARLGAALSAGVAKYTRAPGMAPPPDAPPGPDGQTAEAGAATDSATATATVPMRVRGVTLSAAPGTPAVPLAGRPGGPAGRPGSGTLPSGRSVGAARVADAVRGARATSSAAAARGPRRARLVLKRIDPWSVMKFSFAVSLVLFLVTLVATSVLYLALDAMGVFDSVNSSLGDLVSSAATSGSEGGFKITFGGVILTAGLLGLMNVILFTALATLGAFIYNVCADLVGGVEMTLSERE